MKADLNLSSELNVLRSELEQSFSQKDWSGMGQVLETVAMVSESEGQRDLCLRAQALREIAGHRAHGVADYGADRVPVMVEQLKTRLSIFEWSSQSAG